MPPKSDLAHVLQLDVLRLVENRPAHVRLAVAQTDDLGIRIEASAPGVFRLRCGPNQALSGEPPSGRAAARADLLLARHEAVGEFQTEALPGDEGWSLEQGDVRLEVRSQPFSLRLTRGEQVLLQSADQAVLACTTQENNPGWQVNWLLDDEDGLYGLGETGGDLDRRGEYLSSDDGRALPLIWSVRGWGLYVNTLSDVSHDLAHDDDTTYTQYIDGAVLDVYIFAGEPVEILNQYTALTGRAGQPTLWPMGVWVDQAHGQSLDQLHEVVSGLRKNEYAFDAVRLAAPACYGFQDDKPAFEWDAQRIPDARAMLDRFAALQVQVAAPSAPVVRTGTSLFEEWEDRGWLLCRDDGDVLVLEGDERSGGQPYALLDLTHKDAYRLWSERQYQLIEDGLGAPVCDATFAIPDDVTARGGESGAVLRAVYPALARQALFDAVAGHKTPQEGVMLSTDLFPAVQRFAWQLGPDVQNDWAGFEYSLRTALALGHAGVPVQMHTLGSADAPTEGMSAELYLRWLAACVFSGNFSFQAIPALLPQAFDTQTQALVRHWLEWRYRLVPYVLGIIEDAVRTGLPVQRSMAMCFPDDPMAQAWDTQYLFGPALLVAPVLQAGNEQRIYLPKGDAWWDLSTGRRYEGGTILTMQVGLETIPVFGREGHMLCLGPATQHTGEFNSARLLEEVWMFGMPEHSPVVMRNKIRVMQMQGSSYIKGLEGLKILPSEGLEVKRRGAEVRISRIR
ncbi:glycoside hydrolase family 31 protein [Pusillimonas sp. CC-YST705]|uniref:Glycoside hydrolase family 31 protein n=1 Tax=Mesopusillimonas faecipullorum TaxID=2755040 RepID=A0ABS8C974_9BURK|nr:glycoside hydrolase family 31 protein [Mesopusillimonas faecipullorum]MCB5362581.1 glycoside hydrolase family 31 protein [Mesopusillimonas faecipullorum]